MRHRPGMLLFGLKQAACNAMSALSRSRLRSLATADTRAKMQMVCRSLAVAALGLLASQCEAGEGPFFVTYTHQMEEPGNLEFTAKNATGEPRGGNRFLGTAVEFEYGTTAWWTTEFYLDGQGTGSEGALFTGYRWENRFRLLWREHWINPVLYVEFEDTNGADKTVLEVVGHDGVVDLTAPGGESRREKQREIEMKLILGSHFRGWTIAENFIAEKNLRHAPIEFGYAAGFSRPLAFAATPDRCNICKENFQVGVEVYGGLGTHSDFGLRETSHYIAPTASWTLANGTALQVSPSFGMTATSARFLLRFAQFGRAMHNWLHGGRA